MKGHSPLKSIRTNLLTWETFKMIELNDGKVAIQSMVNNKFVRALSYDTGQGGVLIANSEKITENEKFSIHYLENNDYTIAIKSHSLNKYVTATLWGFGLMRASADHILQWEKFDLIKL